MPIYIPRQRESSLSEPVICYPTEHEWTEPYVYIQSLFRRYGATLGSVKVIPPDEDWRPDDEPWRDDSVVRVPFKVQILSELNGVNRQKAYRDIQNRLCHFLNGDPQSKLIPSVPGICSTALAHFCPPISTPQAQKIAPLLSSSFWVYWPLTGVSCETRITSAVLPPVGALAAKYRRTLPFVTTDMLDPTTGEVFQSVIDEEDIQLTLANGVTAESAKDCINTQLCQVCLVACGFADPAGAEPTTAEQLDRMQKANPALICSACSFVVHAKCIAAETWTQAAQVAYIAANSLDWFCVDCTENPKQVGEQALHFGYTETEPIARREFERRALRLTRPAPHLPVKSKPVEEESEKPRLIYKPLGKPFPGSRKPLRKVEQKKCCLPDEEFWRIINSPNDKTTVLYGTDIDSIDVASGKFERNSFGSKFDWNLRNLALSSDSVLQHLPGAASIAGVSRPWMYVGSRHSAFCWHAEDQFLTSISYLHEGASKVWYSVPGCFRPRIEEAFATLMPDLVLANPDLHHQLTTLIDPQFLYSQFQIPYTRLVQNPGEFIITFPQAYHCGFNRGFNLAEAVNVAIPDWLPHGVEAIEAYRRTKRKAVFCIEQLIWECSLAIIEQTEAGARCPTNVLALNQDVGLFCLEYLKQSVVGPIQKELATSCPIDMIRDLICLEKEVATCTQCYQFCYFACKAGTVCLSCAKQTCPRVWLRYSIEAIERVIEKLALGIPNLFTLRRSARTHKQARLVK